MKKRVHGLNTEYSMKREELWMFNYNYLIPGDCLKIQFRSARTKELHEFEICLTEPPSVTLDGHRQLKPHQLITSIRHFVEDVADRFARLKNAKFKIGDRVHKVNRRGKICGVATIHNIIATEDGKIGYALRGKERIQHYDLTAENSLRAMDKEANVDAAI